MTQRKQVHKTYTKVNECYKFEWHYNLVFVSLKGVTSTCLIETMIQKTIEIVGRKG